MELASRMERLGTESAFAVLAKAKELEASGRTVIHLELGEPDFPTPAHIVDAAIDALRAGHTHYVPTPGILPLRESVSEFLEVLPRIVAAVRETMRATSADDPPADPSVEVTA